MRRGTGRDVVHYLRDAEHTLRKIKDPIEVQPFIDFVQAQIDRLEAADHDWPAGAVLGELGWGNEAGARRWHRWRFEIAPASGIVRRADVEAALHEVGVFLWELYDDVAAEEDVELLPDEYCVTCSDDVTPISIDGERVCPWCDSVLSRKPTVVGQLVLPPLKKSRPRGVAQPRRRKPARISHLQPAPPPDPVALLDGKFPDRPNHVGDARHGMPETFVREAMQLYLELRNVNDVARVLHDRYPGRWANFASVRSGLDYSFRKREVLVLGDRRRRTVREAFADVECQRMRDYLCHPDPGFAYNGPIPAWAIWEAAWLYYYEGLGMLRISRRLRARDSSLTTSGDRGFGNVLRNAFIRNGWPMRDQRTATSAANYRHGMTIHRDKPEYNRFRKRQQNGTTQRCTGTNALTGERCANFAQRGSTRCWAHDPKTTDIREAALAKGRDQAQALMVPSGPFVAWLRARVTEHPSQAAAVAALGLSETILAKILKTGGTSRRGEVGRRLIERTLDTYRDANPDAIVPRFTDLYDVRSADLEAAA